MSWFSGTCARLVELDELGPVAGRVERPVLLQGQRADVRGATGQCAAAEALEPMDAIVGVQLVERGSSRGGYRVLPVGPVADLVVAVLDLVKRPRSRTTGC